MSYESNQTIYKITRILDEASLSVDSTAATSYTLSNNLQWITFQNSGSSPVWMGSASIDPDNKRGYEMLPKSGFTYAQILEEFNVYFKCVSGASSTISIIKG